MCELCADPELWFSTHELRAHPHPDWGSAIYLRLQRHVPPGPGGFGKPRRAVLLLHGGSANHRTFTIKGGLADWLFDQGLDPWLLDWRGSSLVSDCPGNKATLTSADESKFYTFNRAAREDVPAAIAIMRSNGVKEPIALVGHCMGAAVIAEAVASESVKDEIDRIVLLALGLFYEAAIDSRVKSEERILERLALNVKDTPCIDPRVDPGGTLKTPWPADLDRLYEAWPSGLRAHRESEKMSPVAIEMCNRISFMYGMPYRHDNLLAGIHKVPELPKHFGGFPLQMYLHAARNLRAGQATWFESPGLPIVSDKTRNYFIELTTVTLITGELNRLWHRDSIDRMHEWLCRGDSTALRKIKKHVLPKYAHQDLLWGTDSAQDVYPHIGVGLGLPIDRAGGTAAGATSTA